MVRIFRHRDPDKPFLLARYSDTNRAELSSDDGISWRYSHDTVWDILRDFKEVSADEHKHYMAIDQSANKPE